MFKHQHPWRACFFFSCFLIFYLRFLFFFVIFFSRNIFCFAINLMRLEPWYFKQALVNASAGIGDINGAIQTGRQENTTKNSPLPLTVEMHRKVPGVFCFVFFLSFILLLSFSFRSLCFPSFFCKWMRKSMRSVLRRLRTLKVFPELLFLPGIQFLSRQRPGVDTRLAANLAPKTHDQLASLSSDWCTLRQPTSTDFPHT